MGDKGRPSLIGQALESHMGTMTAQYNLAEPIAAQSSIVDTYTATPNGMPMKVFAKVLAPSLTAQAGFSARFQETIQNQLKFSSQNIIKLMDYGSDGDYFFTICEYHKSPTLQEAMINGGPLGAEKALDYTVILINALDHAAHSNVLHGLLSPLSIHLSKSRGPMVADWGLAQLIGGTRLPRAILDDPILAAFTAPEVIRSQPVTALSDQYSLAALFCWMSVAQTVKQGALENLELRAYASALRIALADDPTGRFPTFGDFTRALEAAKAIAGAVSGATPKPPAAPVPPQPASTPIPSYAPPPVAPVMPPALPPAPISPAGVAAYDRTMPEMNVADLQRQMEAMKAAQAAPPAPTAPVVSPPPTPAPATPPPPAPIAPPPAAAYDRTMPEMSIADMQRQMEAMKAAQAAPPAPTAPVIPPPPPEAVRAKTEVVDLPPALSPAAPSQAAYDRTMPEMSIADLQRQMEAMKAAQASPEPPQVYIEAADDAPQVYVEPAEDISVYSEPEPEPTAAVYVEPVAEEPVYVEPVYIEEASISSLDDVVEEYVEPEPDLPRRPGGELPPEPAARPGKSAAPAAKATPPVAPVTPPAPAAPKVNAPDWREQTMPPEPFMPHARQAAPPPPPAPPPVQAPAARLDQTMPEMPAVNYQPPPSSGGVRLDATMPEMPAVQYTPPASIPPASAGQGDYQTPQPSVPYNFNTVQGGSKGPTGRQIEYRYKTGALSREELERGEKPGGDGLTEMMRTVQPGPPIVKPGPDGTTPRRGSPVIWIILAIILLAIAGGIGFTVLKALGVI